MVIKVYGSAMATSRVLMTLIEKELPYDFIRIDISKGEQKSKDYKQLQPFGKVPALDDDGFLIFESRAICKYLEIKYQTGTKLMPDLHSQAYGRFEQACSVEQSYFAAAAETIGTELFIKSKMNLESDLVRVAQAEADLEQVIAYYDRLLATQAYIAGDQYTLADIFHLPNGAALKTGKWVAIFARYPNVDRWLKTLQSRETWKKAAAEAGTLP